MVNLQLLSPNQICLFSTRNDVFFYLIALFPYYQCLDAVLPFIYCVACQQFTFPEI